MVKTVRSSVLFLLVASLCLTALPLTAYATPQTHPNTHVNTGDQRADIVAVALTQVGYMEGANNDTKYGVWYGYNNLGWCGIFVAWCADQAGVPTSVLARTGVANPSAYGLTAKPDGYIPLSGDLFFARDHSHVGLVYYVEGEYFYSLEGNTWENGPEGVYIRKHRLSDVIFASPNYQGGGDHSYVSGSETAHPHREYYKCSDCADQYYTGKTVQRTDCITCVQSSCSHSYGGYSSLSDSQHSRTCTKCAKTEADDHSWNAGTVTKAATCSSTGSKDQICTVCGIARSVTVSKTGTHSYGAWIYLDEGWHARSCSVCGMEEKKAHELSDFEADDTNHWFSCQICGWNVEVKEHQFGDECDDPCAVCEYARPGGHQYQSQWNADGSFHWFSCAVCGIQKELSAHGFAADCDESCDTCGYSRITKHSFNTFLTTDDADHWYECAVCGQRKDVQAHIPETAARQGAIIGCTVCALVLTEESAHTHGFDVVFSDQAGHWGSCSCGLDMEMQAHQWSVRTETCSVCGQAMPQAQADYYDLLPWVAGTAGILLIGIAMIVLLLRKKK